MKRSLIVSIVIFLSLVVKAQPELPVFCEVWLPKSLDKEVIKKKDAYAVLEKPYGQKPTPSQKNYWIVFSDRDNNVTYMTPKSGSAICTKLAFNERLIIASIKDGYALVYSEPKTEKYPFISSAAKSKGWVPLSNLLLWTKGLANDADISYKAIICANLDAKGSTSEGKLYKNPAEKYVEQLSTDMHFYFVMKEEGSKVLLGHYADLSNHGHGLYGWVDNNSFVPWNQRTCLEPTWDENTVNSLSRQNKKWQVFSEKNDSVLQEGVFSLSETRKPSKSRFDSEYIYRTMPAQWLRYPILDGCTDKNYRCSSFGTLGKKSEIQIFDDDIRVAISNIKNTEVINIGIVIDGTSSMKPYFASVKDAIIEGCKYFGENAKVNIAVAIYRDKEDGAYVVETFPSVGGFTDNPNNQNLKRFLDTGGKYGVRSVAKGETESVYYGIKTAVEKFNFNPKQSNLLLVVGDCGDNGKMGVKREEIIDLLAEKKISLMAFQVRNKERESYQTFNTQMTYIMKQSLQKRFDALAKQSGDDSKVVISAVRKEDGSGWDIYKENSKVDIYRYVHRRNSALNKDMDVTELTTLMETTIRGWNERLMHIREKAELVIGGFKPNNDGDGTLTAAVIDVLGGDTARYNRLLYSNAFASFRGWTPKRVKIKSGNNVENLDFYKVVVFLPEPELKSLLINLEPIYNVAKTRSNDRRPYYDAMMSLASTIVAQDKVQESKYKEILAKVFGLDKATTDLGGPSLEDIVDPNVVSQGEYLNLVNKMKACYEKLLQIMGEDYPFIYNASSKDKYYWLPSEYLPL